MKYTIHYYAMLRELTGTAAEEIVSPAGTPGELYAELRERHPIPAERDFLKVAVNDEIREWDTALHDGDRVAFLPPYAGG